ncbi:MAG TPA: penicillin acylase family protein [Candidatus Baltobacteraceae bacterium]|nr:penicillin acylase family protein [Candidatus Baltobacteraceae bacterium]
MFLRVAGALVAAIVIVVAAYAINVTLGMHSTSRVNGTLAGLPVTAPVQILRDARGVAHIRANDEHDLFFAQGYVEAADRGFQLDLLRRFVYGQLSEVLGKAALATDENARTVPVATIAQAQYQKLSARDRAMLQAFADGVNAAYARESTPVEFRILMYRPRPWQPQDSLAVGFATSLDLIDSWNDIASRIGQYIRLTDPCYDAPVTGGLAHIADPVHCHDRAALLDELRDPRPPIGSNEWAAGASHTTTARALLANDPHLRLQIPGVWYLVDLKAPGYHAAGAVLAGVPGVILGHNDRIAWGATNGTVTSVSVFDPPKTLDPTRWQTETFHVRFGGDVARRYYRGRREFGATVRVAGIPRFVLVRWNAYENGISSLVAFDRLDRATSIEDALRGLRAYPGPTQNFEIADTSGRVAYHLAGEIPNDPLWATSIHPASDLAKTYAPIPFDALPHVDPSRGAIVWTANNKMYGPGYRYRLSPEFTPPYRAYRIAELLRARKTYDVAYFTSMQMDTLSVGERELAGFFPQLRTWDGHFSPNSRRATAVYDIRIALANRYYGFGDALQTGRDNPNIFAGIPVDASPQPWGVAGAVTVMHPLGALGMSFLNGTTFAGDGDAFTLHVQKSGFSESFRAVWDIGNWDAGGISLPQGESGRPGSGRYTDEAADWVKGTLIPLPYSDAAVERATMDRLTLQP